MALYRMYKNGIYGKRYKNRYIVKEEDVYRVYVDKDELVTNETFENIEDAEWWISKEVSSEEELELMKNLYSQEIYKLSDLIFMYMEMEKEKKLSKKQKQDYDLLVMVRRRRAKDKPF